MIFPDIKKKEEKNRPATSKIMTLEPDVLSWTSLHQNPYLQLLCTLEHPPSK